MIAAWRLMFKKIVLMFEDPAGRRRCDGRYRDMLSNIVSIFLWFRQNGLFVSSRTLLLEGWLEGSARCKWCNMRPARLAVTTTPAKGERKGALSGFIASLRDIPGLEMPWSYSSSEEGSWVKI
jgi:hypothetical protein